MKIVCDLSTFLVCMSLKWDPQNLLRSICSQYPPTLPPVSVLGENKSKNLWSLRKGHSITLLSLPQLGRCYGKSIGLYVLFRWGRKRRLRSLCEWYPDIYPREGLVEYPLPQRMSCRRTSFTVMARRMGWVRNSRKRVASLPKTRTHCTIARPGKEQEEEVCEENSVANLKLLTYDDKTSNILR